jgi:hypothetical protein
VKPAVVIKRDGSAVPFELDRISEAIRQSQLAIGIDDLALANELGSVVHDHLTRTSESASIGIEDIQDAVVHVLQESGNYDAALAYTRYRDARERFRRSRRILTEDRSAPNLVVIDPDGRRRPWEHGWLVELIAGQYGLGEKAARDALLQVEAFLVESPLLQLTTPLLMSLVDAALVRCGMHAQAEARSPLRVDRATIRQALEDRGDAVVRRAGEEVLRQLSLSEELPDQVLKLYCRGRLWVDGLDDPRRGSHFAATVDGSSNPWHVLTQGFALASNAARHWRRVSVVLPPSILGHLERGATSLVAPVAALAEHAFVYLYCDGRTPLLENWPFETRRVSIATYADDFLLLRRLQELQLPLLSGPHLMEGGWRSRTAVALALNAQGLDNEYSQMDLLAMALVTAARIRLRQLSAAGEVAGDLRFAIYGLTASSPSHEYLERQVVQEALRNGLDLRRTSHLPEEACAHLGRLLE